MRYIPFITSAACFTGMCVALYQHEIYTALYAYLACSWSMIAGFIDN